MRSASLFAVAVLAVLMMSVAMPASAYINLLQNPGFETGLATPWTIGGTIGMVTAADSHTGTYAALISYDGYMYQEIAPRGCAEYLEFWYNGTGGQFGVRYSDDTYHWQVLPSSDLVWASVHVDLDTTKVVYRVQGVVLLDYVYVDDFDLEVCTPAVGGIVIPANTLAVLAPWLAVIGIVGCIGAVVVVAKKRRA